MWSRFFCHSVYITMYLNDHQRTSFYESIGLNTKQFNQHVIVETNIATARLFPAVCICQPIKYSSIDAFMFNSNVSTNLPECGVKQVLLLCTLWKIRLYISLHYACYELLRAACVRMIVNGIPSLPPLCLSPVLLQQPLWLRVMETQYANRMEHACRYPTTPTQTTSQQWTGWWSSTQSCSSCSDQTPQTSSRRFSQLPSSHKWLLGCGSSSGQLPLRRVP